MIRSSEAVLPGHPDKFCDQVADAIVAECYRADPEAYCQVEVACWSDEIWLTGGIVTRSPIARPLEDITRETGRELGYVEGNAIDANRYQVRSSVCVQQADPRQWSQHVNDQCISLGWAGYDARVRYLPPEHFLAQSFREALTESFRAGGALAAQGPDGKLLVRLRENHDHWVLEHVLVTVQHLEDVAIIDIAAAVDAELSARYEAIRATDARWAARWGDVQVLVNPNGPLVNGGSDGDNGQTGRKLVADYYGPRVPLGGGALCGKDLSHIDRASAYAARQAAVEAVARGAGECLVTLTWAPNGQVPLDVSYELQARVEVPGREAFAHERIRGAFGPQSLSSAIARGGHFFELDAPWNHGSGASDKGGKACT
jgi:S-adenosylmethionine synthetase